ncbi:MAG: AAA family ATPase [Candidatus Entotheonellia bacterium]
MEVTQQIALLQENIERALVGKGEVVKFAIVALLARGHLLIEDVPGVGKTTLAAATAKSVGGTFQRIQFTSDLLPSDIIGVSVYDQRIGEFTFRPGPIFANVILADEINRTTPKTQSSLLEAMSDFQVSVDHHTYKLAQPFIVLATQNPLEYYGTHPLPESQMDRFLLRIRIGYPEEVDEKRILRGERVTTIIDGLQPVLTAAEVLALQRQADLVRVDEALLHYLLTIVRATRNTTALALGVSPRGSLALYRAAQALAFIEGRTYCIPDDIKALAVPALAHRVILHGQWEHGKSGGEEAESILQEIIAGIPVPT